MGTKEGRITELENRSVEYIWSEKRKRIVWWRNEYSLRELCDRIKRTTIHIVEVPEREEKDIRTAKNIYLK